MATNNNQRLAVLIDADNAQASLIQELLAEVSRYACIGHSQRSRGMCGLFAKCPRRRGATRSIGGAGNLG